MQRTVTCPECSTTDKTTEEFHTCSSCKTKFVSENCEEKKTGQKLEISDILEFLDMRIEANRELCTRYTHMQSRRNAGQELNIETYDARTKAFEDVKKFILVKTKSNETWSGNGWQLHEDGDPKPGDVLFRHSDGSLDRSPLPNGFMYGIVDENGKAKKLTKPFPDMPYYIWGPRGAETIACKNCGMALCENEVQKHRCPDDVEKFV